VGIAVRLTILHRSEPCSQPTRSDYIDINREGFLIYISTEAILKVALTIERQAIDFYTRVKDRFDDELLDFLIDQEKQHLHDFKTIFDKSANELKLKRFDNPYMDDEMLAATFADTEIFGQVEPDKLDQSTLLDVAIGIEKNAILFYGYLIERLNEDRGDELLPLLTLLWKMREEEKWHLESLVKKKMRLKEDLQR
jgi:rubrerythrin